MKKTLSLIYLSLVPPVVAALGFGIGHVSYRTYLPLWILNVIIMTAAAWNIGLHVIKSGDKIKTHAALGAFFLVVPWILVSIFAGFGPPPETATGWVETGTEQQVRYFILVIAGVFIAFGFSFLRHQIKNHENIYSQLGYVAIIVAIPLFIINMIFWGNYLPEVFKIMVASNTDKMPEWSLPIRKEFGFVSAIEVALTYFAIAVFVQSLQKAGWFTKGASIIYIIISLIAFAIIILSAFFPDSLQIPGFAVSIPAIPFIMPYFIGVNLLKRIAK